MLIIKYIQAKSGIEPLSQNLQFYTLTIMLYSLLYTIYIFTEEEI